MSLRILVGTFKLSVFAVASSKDFSTEPPMILSFLIKELENNEKKGLTA